MRRLKVEVGWSNRRKLVESLRCVKTGCAVKTRCQTPEIESYIGSSGNVIYCCLNGFRIVEWWSKICEQAVYM